MKGRLFDEQHANHIKPGKHLNANATCKNEAIVQCRRVTAARQTALNYATNVRRTAECYLLTVGTSKGICIQYIYVWSIRCLFKYRTVCECTIHSASLLVRIHRSRLRSDVNPA